MANENEELTDEAFEGDDDDGDELVKFCCIELTRQPVDSRKLFGDDQIEPVVASSCDVMPCDENIMSVEKIISDENIMSEENIVSELT